MTLPRSVGEVLRSHVTLENEAIDRMYLNVYVPGLQHMGGVVWYLRQHRGQRFASTATVAPMIEAFVARITQFIEDEGLELVRFRKGQRKDDLTQQYLACFQGREGVRLRGHRDMPQLVAAFDRASRQHLETTTLDLSREAG